MSQYASRPQIDTTETTTLLEPDGSGEGHWVGAPCVHVHEEETYLAVRKRDPKRRGHTVHIYRRRDNEYESIIRITADELGVTSIERPSLITDPDTGKLKLYLPVDLHRNSWRIWKLGDVDRPEAFDPDTARVVLTPRDGATDRATVKDPYIVTVGGRYYGFYAGDDGKTTQAHLATSMNGENWNPVPEPVLDSQYWHDERTRISCVVPAPDAPVWLVFYDGSGRTDYGSTWNLRTGMAISHDLETVMDASLHGPIYSAPTAQHRIGPQAFATCRYMDVLVCADQWEVFFEIAREDGSFTLEHTTVEQP